jgi:hypothetical protein
MALGSGKYDAVCTMVREITGGGVIVIVLDGIYGSGFAAQTDAAALKALPDILENMAAQIRRDGSGV